MKSNFDWRLQIHRIPTFSSPRLSRHAGRRSAQRAISSSAIVAALTWGRETGAGGGDRFLYVGHRAVARAARAGFDIRAHLGVTVIETRTGLVKTVYRNLSAPRPRRARRGRR